MSTAAAEQFIHKASGPAVDAIIEHLPLEQYHSRVTTFDPSLGEPDLDNPGERKPNRHDMANPTVRMHVFSGPGENPTHATEVYTPQEGPGTGAALEVVLSQTPDYADQTSAGTSVFDIRLGVQGSIPSQKAEALRGAGMIVASETRGGSPRTTVGIRTRDGAGVEEQVGAAMEVLAPRIRGHRTKPHYGAMPRVAIGR